MRRRAVHRRSRHFQVHLGPAEDLFLGEVRVESEAELLPELLVADPELSIGSWKQILLHPLLIVGERRQRRRLRGAKVLFQGRRLLHERLKLLLDQLGRALVLLDGCLGVHLGRRLEICLRRRDHPGNRLQPPDDRAQPLLWRRELAGNQRVDRAADVVLQRVPLPTAERLQFVDLRLEPVLQDAVVDRVLGGELCRIDARQLGESAFRGSQITLHSLCAVVVEPGVIAMFAQPRGRLRVSIEKLLDVLLCERLESGVFGCGGGSQQEADEEVHGRAP